MSDEESGAPQAAIDEMFNKQATGKDAALPEASAAFVPDGMRKMAAKGSTAATQPRPEAEPRAQDTATAPTVHPALDDSALETMRQTIADQTQRTVELADHLHQLEQELLGAADFGAAILRLDEKL